MDREGMVVLPLVWRSEEVTTIRSSDFLTDGTFPSSFLSPWRLMDRETGTLVFLHGKLFFPSPDVRSPLAFDMGNPIG